MPSGTTSLPMPSPAMIATRYVFAIISSLFVRVPDIRRYQPPVADLAPDDDVFAGQDLWRGAFGLEAERADLARRVAAERQDVDDGQFAVGQLLGRPAPEFFDRRPALDHFGARRQHIGVLGVHRRHRGRVALVEGGAPLLVKRLDGGGVLRLRRGGESNQRARYQHGQSSHRDALRSCRAIFPRFTRAGNRQMSIVPVITATQRPPIRGRPSRPPRFSTEPSRKLGRPISTPWAIRRFSVRSASGRRLASSPTSARLALPVAGSSGTPCSGANMRLRMSMPSAPSRR